MERAHIKPRDVAQMFAVKIGTVSGWINTGQLTAYNINSRAKRPIYRMTATQGSMFRQMASPDSRDQTVKRRQVD